MRRNSIVSMSPTSPNLGNDGTATSSSIAVWLPKDRQTLRQIVAAYFMRLNFHRPVFSRASFEQRLAALYDGQVVQHDPGFICGVYLVLALGTLSELNHRVHGMEKEGNAATVNSTSPKTLMPPEWPGHEEFFGRALAVKPELRVTVSSLQALILLHWYLYTEVGHFGVQVFRGCLIVSSFSDKDEPYGVWLVAWFAFPSSLDYIMTQRLLRKAPFTILSPRLPLLPSRKRRLNFASDSGVSFSFMTVERRSCLAARSPYLLLTPIPLGPPEGRAGKYPSTSYFPVRSQKFRLISSIPCMLRPLRARTLSCVTQSASL